jgi:hypothetical protein
MIKRDKRKFKLLFNFMKGSDLDEKYLKHFFNDDAKPGCYFFKLNQIIEEYMEKCSILVPTK